MNVLQVMMDHLPISGKCIPPRKSNTKVVAVRILHRITGAFAKDLDARPDKMLGDLFGEMATGHGQRM
jgi:hypothetical protein